jgi:hypothetical protein
MDQATGLSKATVSSAAATAPGDRKIEELRQNIVQTRQEISETVDQLGEKFKASVDWRSYIGQYPLVAVGGVALLGFYLTRKLLVPKRSTTDELLQNLVRAARDGLLPKRQSLWLTALSLAGKFAYDKFQEYQDEQQQQQLQEQLEMLQRIKNQE